MSNIRQKSHDIEQSSQSSIKPQQSQNVNQSQNPKFPQENMKLITIAFLTGLTLSITSQRYIGHNWQDLASRIFSVNTISEQLEKLTVLKQSMVLIATLQFIIAMVIMSIRIFGQKISPVGEKDPFIITVLNRILNNNVEQSVVFFCLYSYLLLSSQIKELSTEYVFGLPLLFLIGRVLFCLSYIVGSLFNGSTLRSWGFVFVFVVNYLMIVEMILNKTTFMRDFLFH